MTIHQKVRDEELQYGIKKVAAKISALSLDNIDNQEYLTGKQILSPHQHRRI